MNQNQLPNYWGTTPEEQFYKQQNIKSTNSYFTNPSTKNTLFTRSWQPLTTTPPRGIICMLHGYGNDISWTFQSTPIYLAQNGYSCFALDLLGHGKSDGLKAFVPDLDVVILDCIAFFDSIMNIYDNNDDLPVFLYGESMGGAICLLISMKLDGNAGKNRFKGAILIAPMCRISDNVRPKWPIPEVLRFVGRFMPKLAIVPSPSLVEKSVKVERKREIAVMNPVRYNGKPRLGTVIELIRATDELSAKLEDVVIPFIVLHGSADVVTDPGVSRDLYEKAKSEDKAIKIYEGMMHSLLFGETDENVELVRGDILGWLNDRCN